MDPDALLLESNLQTNLESIDAISTKDVMRIINEVHEDLQVGLKTPQRHLQYLKRFNPAEGQSTRQDTHFHFPRETACISR
jgi:hypothetical protein